MTDLFLPLSYIRRQLAARAAQETLAREAEKRAYYEQHACCPQCGSDEIQIKGGGIWLGGPDARDNSLAYCGKRKCKWKGKVHDLVPKK